MFLLVGDEKAMLIDTGVGIGDLAGFAQTLTDKPLMVCYSHNHVDHIGGAGAFDQAFLHPKEMAEFAAGGAIGVSVEGRLRYIRMIAEREKGLPPQIPRPNRLQLCSTRKRLWLSRRWWTPWMGRAGV